MRNQLQSRQAFHQTYHSIDDIAVELAFGSVLLEQRERASIADWLRDDLLPALDELFSFYAPGAQTIRFEQLVFDFGHLPASDYRQIIREQLLQKLTRLIKDKSLPLEFNEYQAHSENRIAETESAVKHLLNYLRTGQLDAQAPAKTKWVAQVQAESPNQIALSGSSVPPKLHQQLLESLVSEQHIAAQLRALPNREQLISRLLKQFSERHRTALLRQLAPVQLEPALALLDILQTMPSSQSSTDVHTIWQYLLEIALAQPEANASEWLNQFLQKWLQQYPGNALEFIRHLQQPQNNTVIKLESTLAKHSALLQSLLYETLKDNSNPLRILLQNANLEGHPEKTVSNTSTSDGFQPLTVQQTLAGILIQGDAEQLMRYWSLWQVQARPLLIAGLKHYLIKAELRQQLLLKLPALFISELLLLLAPDLQPLVNSLNSRAEDYKKSLGSLLRNVSSDSKQNMLTGKVEDWSRRAYEIIATQIFTGLNNDTSDVISITSLDKLWNELVFHIANQYDIAAVDVRRLWDPLFLSTGHNVDPASYTTSASTAATESSVEQSALASTRSALIENLHTLFAQKNVVGLENIWPQVNSLSSYANDPEIIAAILHYWRVAEIRSEILRKLSLPVLAQIMYLAAPHYKNWFARLATQRVSLLAEASSLDTTQPMGEIERSNRFSSNAEEWLREVYTITSTAIWDANSVSSETATETDIDQLSQLFSKIFANKYQLPVEPLYFLWKDIIASGISIAGKTQSQVAAPIAAQQTIPATAQQIKVQSTTQVAIPKAMQESLREVLQEVLQEAPEEASQEASQKTIHKTGQAGSGVATSTEENSHIGNDSTSTESFAATTDNIVKTKPSVVSAAQLMAGSEHELFDWCMSIKDSVRARADLPLDEQLVARLIDSFVKYSPNFSPEFRSYFLAAINQAIENISAKAEFLQRVLFALIDDELIDLDALALSPMPNDAPTTNSKTDSAAQHQNKNKQLQGKHESESISEQRSNESDLADRELRDKLQNNINASGQQNENRQKTVQQKVTQEKVTQEKITQQKHDREAEQSVDNEQQVQQRLAQLHQELLAGRIDPFGLRMNLYYWQRLVEQFFLSSNTNAEYYSTLLQSIRHYAAGAVDPNYFFQQVIHALAVDAPLDLEVFITRSTKDHAAVTSSNSDDDKVSINDSSTDHSGLGDSNVDDLPVSQSKENYLPTNVSQQANLVASNVEQESFEYETLKPEIFKQKSAEKNIGQQSAAVSLQEVVSGISEFEVSDSKYKEFNESAGHNNSALPGSDDPLRKPQLTLEQLLLDLTSPNAEQLQQLQQHVNLLLQHFTQAQANDWLGVLRNFLCAQRLIQQVPGHLLHQIVQRLQAGPFAALDPIVKLATEALALLVPDADPLVIKQARWEFVFLRLFGPAQPLDSAELLQRCCEQLAQALGISDSQRLLQLAERRLALLKPVAAARPNMSLHDGNDSNESELNFEAGIHLNNVGMVLAAPFLPRLFSMFNLLEDGKFIHPGAADRAVHLLQYMVTGRNETPEYELILNKILCGISTSMPVSEGIDITEQEKTVIEQMLQSMIQHWRALGSTSVAGLRETFFQRQGWLVLDEEYWRLKVQERTFDMLLDRLPWSISMIKHGWMDKPLRVSWREQS